MSKELSGELQEFLAYLRAEAECHKQALAEKEQDIVACERVVAILNEWRQSKYDPADSGRDELDLTGCRTQGEALYLIAKRNSGVVRVKDAGDLIADAGLSKAKKSSLVATLHNYLSSNQDWEWQSPGVFSLVGYKNGQPEENTKQN